MHSRTFTMCHWASEPTSQTHSNPQRKKIKEKRKSFFCHTHFCWELPPHFPMFLCLLLLYFVRVFHSIPCLFGCYCCCCRRHSRRKIILRCSSNSATHSIHFILIFFFSVLFRFLVRTLLDSQLNLFDFFEFNMMYITIDHFFSCGLHSIKV